MKRKILSLALCYFIVFTSIVPLSELPDLKAMPMDGAGHISLQISEDEIEKRADEIISGMTLKQKVSQMLLVEVNSGYNAAKQKKNQYGGIVLFADSFQNTTDEKLKKRVGKLQKASKMNMLIAVDEEGGMVTRVSRYKKFLCSKFAAPRTLYQKGGYEKVKSDADAKAIFLKNLGINTNLAPVADVAYNKNNFIYQRSFSTSAKKTAKFIQITVRQSNQKGLVSTLKHFPGYGNNGDTHTNIISDKRALSTFEKRDLKPFRAGIKENVPMIMISHNIVQAFDKKNPATISKKVHKYLRQKMKYEGVIVTDSMGMAGVNQFVGSTKKAVVRAVLAGNDMICTPASATGKKALINAVKNGRISETQIDTSVKRIIKMKLRLGIIE